MNWNLPLSNALRKPSPMMNEGREPKFAELWLQKEFSLLFLPLYHLTLPPRHRKINILGFPNAGGTRVGRSWPGGEEKA